MMLAGLLLAVAEVVAAPVSKCVVNGAVTYQQGPCPSNEVRKLPSTQELNAQEKKRRAETSAGSPKKPAVPSNAPGRFSCDGRTYCSQMTSCAEAKYFLAKCPGVKMDGDKNGIPCEQQWCGR